MQAAKNIGTKAQRPGHRLTEITLERVSQGLNQAGEAGRGNAGGAAGEFQDIYSKAGGNPVSGIGDSVGGSLGSDVGAIKKRYVGVDEGLLYIAAVE